MNSINQYDVETTQDDESIIHLLQSFDPPIPIASQASSAQRPWLNKGDQSMPNYRSRWIQTPTKAVSLAVIVLLVLAGAGFGFLNTRGVSAAEIIANNRQRLESNASFGLQSYRGTITSVQNGVFQASANLIVQGDSTRAERCRESQSACEIFIETPTHSWSYDPLTKEAERTAYESPRPQAGLAGGRLTGDSLDQLIASASLNADVDLEGTETILNRSAYVLLIDPDVEEMPTMRVSIDQEYFITLKIAELDEAGNEVGVIGFTSLEINPVIDPAVFEFSPPEDATVNCFQSLSLYESTQVEVDGQTVTQESVMRPIDMETGEVMEDQPIPCP